MKTSASWTHEHAGAFRSAVTNSHWTQIRLCRANLAQDRCCQLCVAYGLVESGSNDPKYLGTLMHRYWTCPVLQPFRELHCPGWLRAMVNAELNSGVALTSDRLLLYTRALHKSVEPSLACCAASGATDGTFNWLVQPGVDGIPVGRVYADGSRLFSEHRYCNLLASHGWAFVVADGDGRVVAGASGLIPSWINGIYGAELWALLQAASYASPGSPLHVDCNAVKVGVHNGLRWAQSSSRKLGRIWIPLANILDDCTDSVAWILAHCSDSAVGRPGA